MKAYLSLALLIIAVLLAIVFASSFFIDLSTIFAFTGPTQSPPGGSGALAINSAGDNLTFTKNNANATLGIIRSGTSPVSANLAALADAGAVGTGSNDPFHIRTNDTDRISILANGDIEFNTPAYARDGLYSDRLSGEGRPGVIAANINGECVRNVGGKDIKISRFIPPTTWDNAAAACPQDWWVCTRAERGSGSCGVNGAYVSDCRPNIDEVDPVTLVPLGSTYKGRDLGYTYLGWVADAVPPASGGAVAALTHIDGTQTNIDAVKDLYGEGQHCRRYPVWCCGYN